MPTYYSRTEATGTGAQTEFTIDWDADNGHYLAAAHVKAKIDAVVTTDFSVSGNTVTFDTAPDADAEILIYRDTPLDVIETFTRRGTPSSGGFNTIFRRLQYIAQEVIDNATTTISLGAASIWDALGNKIGNLADGSADTDAATVGQMNTALALKQPLDATLTALAALTVAANKMIYATGADTFSVADLTAAARDLLDDADAATMRTTLGAQATSSKLDAIAALTWAADKLILLTGTGTVSAVDVTTFARSVLDDADAATARTTLGLGDLSVLDVVELSDIDATGTPDGTTFLRGDGSWSVPSGAGDVLAPGTTTQYKVPYWDAVANTLVDGVAPGTSGNVLKSDGTQWTSASPVAPYVLLRDVKASGTDGGTFTSGAWRTRDLNTEVTDTGSICTLASNQFTLPAGTYLIYALVPARSVNAHTAKLVNITDTADVLFSPNILTAAADTIANSAIISGQFTITGTKTFEIQHQCVTTRSTDGFGASGSFSGANIFTQVEIRKVV